MDRKTAEQLMKNFVALTGPLNAATSLANNIADKDEQSAVRREIGKVMGRIYTELMTPIIRQYPDLDPDKS
ncbi:MAG: nuclear receptor NHR-99 [Gammaproteobacteria bacterium]|nr:nuclear receptor NHR-99 [Gammaproteobacteria bacterium]